MDGWPEVVDGGEESVAERAFELSPALLDGVEIRRARREIRQFDLRVRDEVAHLLRCEV